MESASTFLWRYHDDGDEFLDRIIRSDEAWVAHITPETKQQLQGISPQDEIQADFFSAEIDVHGVLG